MFKPLQKILPRVPGFGKFAKGVSPLKNLLGPAGVIFAFGDLANWMESQAPGVQKWLRGGWRGKGEVANGQAHTKGQCAVQYDYRVKLTRKNGGITYNILPPGFVRGVGPFSFVEFPLEYRLYNGLGQYGWWAKWQGPSDDPNKIGQLPEFDYIERTDRQPDTCGALVPVTTPVNRPTQKTEPDPAKEGKPGPVPGPGDIPGTGTGPHTPTTDWKGPNPFGPWLPEPLNPDRKEEEGSRDPGPLVRPDTKPSPDPSGDGTGGTGTTPDICQTPCIKKIGSDTGKTQDFLQAREQKLDRLLALLDTGLDAATLQKVNVIDDKLGAQIVDGNGNKIGIAGQLIQGFQRMDKWFKQFGLDRIVNLLTLAASLHNAAMLSNNLIQTLGQVISNALAAIGIKDADDNPIDINGILTKSANEFMVDLLGAEVWAGTVENWKRANRIIQAGANIINSIQSIRFSIMSALETIGGWNAKVGNALKKWGVVGGNAYPWMNPNPNFDSPFFRAIELTENSLNSLDSVTSEIISAQDVVANFGNQKTELEQSLSQGQGVPKPEHQPSATKSTQEKAASGSPAIDDVDLIKPGTED